MKSLHFGRNCPLTIETFEEVRLHHKWTEERTTPRKIEEFLGNLPGFQTDVGDSVATALLLMKKLEMGKENLLLGGPFPDQLIVMI